MKITLEPTPLSGVFVVSHEFAYDPRGYFLEVYRRDLFEAAGLPGEFLQLNQSRSSKGVVRGLHFQWKPPMAKLMRVARGEAFLVAVDIRKGSPTLGRWFGITLSEESGKQLWAPAGCARGFCVLSDIAEIQYFCTSIYNPPGEAGVRWNDPEIGIDWPVTNPLLSPRDAAAPSLAEWLASKESDTFKYE